jgi:hypothetical protein
VKIAPNAHPDGEGYWFAVTLYKTVAKPLKWKEAELLLGPYISADHHMVQYY